MARKRTTTTDTTPAVAADTTPTTPTPEDTVSTTTDTTPAVAADTTPADTTPAEVPAATDTPDTGTDTTDTPDTPTPAEAFSLAWSVCMAAADPTTGTLTPADLDPLGAAFRAMPRRERDGALLTATTGTTADAMTHLTTDPARMAAMLTASQTASEHLRTMGTAPAVPVITTADKALALAAAMVAVGGIAPESLASVVGVEADVLQALATASATDPTDEAPTPDAHLPRVRAIVAAANGRKAPRARSGGASRTGSGSRGGNVPAHVLEVLTAAGHPMKFGDIHKAHSSVYPDGMTPGGAAEAAVKRGIEGVVAVKVDGRNGAALA